MEAMACGCAIVTTGTCMLPEIIQNGVNGFISNDEKELRGYLEMLLSDEKLATELGNNARKTILERYSLQQFVDSWNKIFRELL
jgi:glycosyltransferase involved in cell wall biosynthesis